MPGTSPRVLIVDNDPDFRAALAERLGGKGFQTVEADSGEEALRIVRSRRADFAVVDMRMPGMDGLETISGLKNIQPDIPVALLTAFGGQKLQQATAALDGHYFEKGDMSRFWDFLGRMQGGPGMIIFAPGAGAVQDSGLQAETVNPASRDRYSRSVPRLIGQTRAMQDLKEAVDKYAVLDCTVLIMGETGTGKELVSRLIHDRSTRSQGRFLAVNCGSFSPELLSNELFGHEREAFSGANMVKEGLFEATGGGTILLDEIGGTPHAMQVQLLRVLQEKTVLRMGGTEEIPVDVRILAATNKELSRRVESGEFREDLYYRLNAFTLRIPPLRDRRDDIPPLCSYFFSKYNKEFGKQVDGFDDEVMHILRDYPFPGNVRELENIVERAAILCETGRAGRDHLPERFRKPEDGLPAPVPATAPVPPSGDDLLSLAEVEQIHIRRVLKALDGNKNKAARTLGISRASLWRKLKQMEAGNGDA